MGWPQTCSDLPSSASGLQGLGVYHHTWLFYVCLNTTLGSKGMGGSVVVHSSGFGEDNLFGSCSATDYLALGKVLLSLGASIHICEIGVPSDAGLHAKPRPWSVLPAECSVRGHDHPCSAALMLLGCCHLEAGHSLLHSWCHFLLLTNSKRSRSASCHTPSLSLNVLQNFSF